MKRGFLLGSSQGKRRGLGASATFKALDVIPSTSELNPAEKAKEKADTILGPHNNQTQSVPSASITVTPPIRVSVDRKKWEGVNIILTFLPLKESLKTFEEYMAGCTVCALYPGVKESILALPSFPCRPKVSPLASMNTWNITSAPGFGLGMFAVRHISHGEVIEDERPLLIAPALLPDDRIFKALVEQKMPEAYRHLFYELHNCKGDTMTREQGIIATNAVGVPDLPGNSEEDQMLAVLMNISRINHSCTPNAEYRWELSSFTFQLRALKSIRPGEQITISYTELYHQRDIRRESLREWSFTCQCPACSLTGAASCEDDTRRALVGESIQTLKEGLQAWLKDITQRLPDNDIIEKGKKVVQMMEETGALGGDWWSNAVSVVCMAYIALGDRENAKEWATRCAVASLVKEGNEGKWAEWSKNPEKSPIWRMRAKK
ncbi:hypothetical protein BOTBODRAFT_57347 [Botryobasidium botryosum FD-172 SS1]|uniref:SET domain-containing protein n=1 Tax=Botryobasidium botryosum (strain FD-172 SS1) TaxID=930990 RepID=A0A067MI64_BOTB1|nr:hypothetical protein BOTBODRAFT_57347 [Botryobasidium botryosum FD-172 SS1]